MNTLLAPSDRYQPLAWSGPSYAQARTYSSMVPKSHRSSSPWKQRLMNAKAIALQLTIAALLSLSLLSSPAAAIDPEKQPIYVNIELGGPIPSLCGTGNGVCTASMPGQRLIIEHVSGFAFIPNTDQTTTGVSLLVKDPQLGLKGGNAFHTFVATKTATTSGPNGTRCLFVLHAIQNDVESGSDLPILSGGLSGRVRIPRESALAIDGPARLAPLPSCTSFLRRRMTLNAHGEQGSLLIPAYTRMRTDPSCSLGNSSFQGGKGVVESDGTRNRCKPAIAFAEFLVFEILRMFIKLR